MNPLKNLISIPTRLGRSLRPSPWTLMLAALVLAPLVVATLSADAQDADEELARELLDATDDMYRGQSSRGTMTMHVKTERWDRTMSMRMWSEGEDKSLIQILSPPKEAGMATLKVDDNIWNYLPKVDRTMKVPASMMSGAWMGSHFSNDDLVKESRMADDYTYAITARPGTDGDHYVVELTPKPDAPVVWGKVVVTIRGNDKLPLSIEYYDEQGEKMRSMLFEDFREMAGRTMPCRMKLVPEDKPGEFTEIVYDEIEFDVEIPASTFTLQALKP